jgi:large subunit ribosomal protein L15
MITTLCSLQNASRPAKRTKLLGRGTGSGRGKTSGRGQKGAGSRSGYKVRHGFEGGQFPLYMKLPIRGFSNARFRKEKHSINLKQIEAIFNDGDVVNMETLREHGFISGKSHGLKILGDGELTKKVKIEANAASGTAQEKLKAAGIELTLITA